MNGAWSAGHGGGALLLGRCRSFHAVLIKPGMGKDVQVSKSLNPCERIRSIQCKESRKKESKSKDPLTVSTYTSGTFTHIYWHVYRSWISSIFSLKFDWKIRAYIYIYDMPHPGQRHSFLALACKNVGPTAELGQWQNFSTTVLLLGRMHAVSTSQIVSFFEWHLQGSPCTEKKGKALS